MSTKENVGAIHELPPNPIGKLINQWWLKLHDKYPEIEIDEFQIMPNHMHGIIIITHENAGAIIRRNVGAIIQRNVGAIHELPLHNIMLRRKMLLPNIIGYFKMNSAKQINKLRNTPGTRVWQRNYYEHVIRNEKELTKIREYIIQNPENWEKNEYHV